MHKQKTPAQRALNGLKERMRTPAAPASSRRARARDHWSFLFGEIAVYAFVVLLVTGAFLTVFFEPSTKAVTYDGSYAPLRGVQVSEAYESTLDLSFEVRGGLLMRQIHHWAALVFIAAITLQLLRMFFTGAYRRPRGLNWLIWVGLLVLGMAAGVTGTILPDDMLSGGSLGLIQGVTQSIPVFGTDLMGLLFGGEFPGDDIIPRFYWLHVLAIPALAIGLFALRRRLVRRHGHTRFRMPARRLTTFQTAHMAAPRATSVAMFLATCGVLTLLGTVAQINPIWQFGPYKPGDITAGAVPGWYMGFLDGAIRIMPGWEFGVAGHPLTLAVLVPALIVPGAFFTVLAAYPALERRLSGDRDIHHFLDRPRDAATRTAVGAAGITFYGLLWAAAANDQIAYNFHLSLFAVTWFFRVAVFVGPVLAFALTQQICLFLTSRERREAEHGRETGRIVMNVDGGFSEIHEPVRELTALGAGSD
ncbi:cytochrome bc1 complex cytochrome b subunit [Actinomadura rudentiformis]|uniref:Cytochrome bc1 complex cytochrome b subunit n=1 Tax=Actinomadura rudentiformis TaxID=359158 RepID=A0A6H9YKH0_9ACTN|nr:cytochrome b N-terminal domain-containing protein [Actinomadura rudentiformis]KAB2339650.1 cytochrome bc complex cytochrome b subunit [Actinomadura rudentiformis]